MKTRAAKDTLKQWLIWQLRRLSYRWPPRSQALRDAQVNEREFRRRPGVPVAKVSKRITTFYECARCMACFPRREVSVDHIMPVVDPSMGFISFDEFIRRLFCRAEGFQILCNDCHDKKTKDEGKRRTAVRRERKAHAREREA